MQGAFFPPMESLTWFRFLVALIPQVWTILTSPFSRWKKKIPGKGMGEGFMMQLLHELSTLFHQLVPKYWIRAWYNSSK